MKKLFKTILALLLIFVSVPCAFATYYTLGDQVIEDYSDCLDENGNNLGEHDYQLVGGKAATCTDEGKQIYQCTKCGAQQPVFSDPLSPTGQHQYVQKVRDGSLCTEPQIQYDECTVCGDIANEVVIGEPKEHTYVISDYTAPTCLKNGFYYYMCSTCGYTNPEYVIVEKLGHNYQITAKKDRTCTEDGVTTYTCANCGDSYDYIEYATGTTGHNYEDKVEAATCTKAEKHYQQCTLCNNIANEEYVGEPLGHTFVEKVRKAATCTTAEVCYKECTVCGYITEDYNVGEPLGHTYVINNSTEKTCTEDGNIIYSCSTCGETYAEIIYATGHDYKEVVTKEATCTENGSSYKECSKCGKRIDETTIEALGHDYSGNRYACARCGEKIEIQITFSKANITKAPEEEKKEEEQKEEEKEEEQEVIVIISYDDEDEEEEKEEKPLTRSNIQEDCPHENIRTKIGDTGGSGKDYISHTEYKCEDCGKIWNEATHYYFQRIKQDGCHYTATCACGVTKTYTLHDHLTSTAHYTGKKSVKKVNGKAQIVYEVEVYRYCTTCKEKTESITWYVSSKDSWTSEWNVSARNLYNMEDEYPEIEAYWPQEVRRFIKKSKTQPTRN